MTRKTELIDGGSARDAHRAFLKLVEPHRPMLWRYCRGLMVSPWDAEDLLQETLARAYAKLPLLWQAIDLPAYLRRMAKNIWIDGLDRRRLSELPVGNDLEAEESCAQPDVLAIRALFNDVLGVLTARQAAIVLYTVVGYSGADIATRLGTSEGAVRVELNRARSRLSERRDGARRQAAPEIVNAFVAAYNTQDIEALSELIAEHAHARIVGVAEEFGARSIIENSIADDFGREGLIAGLHVLHGEPVIAVIQDGRLIQLIRLTESDGEVVGIDTYFFCPELLREIAAELGVVAQENGYYFDG